MRVEFDHKEWGKIFYEEGFVTGRKKLSVNGREMRKSGKREYCSDDGMCMELNESYFKGTVLRKGDESVHLTKAIKWYDIALSLLPFVLWILIGRIIEIFADVPALATLLIANFALVSVCCLFCMKEAILGYKILLTLAAIGIDFLFYIFFAVYYAEGIFKNASMLFRLVATLSAFGGCLCVLDLLLVLLKEKKIWLIVLFSVILALCLCGIICGTYYGIEFADNL